MGAVQVSEYNMRALERAVQSIGQGLDHIDSQVREVKFTQDKMEDRLQDLARTLDAFIARDLMDKSLARAQAELITVRQEVNTQFGHYGEVRRMATGVLQAVDSGIVTQEVIQGASEEVMIKTPRYWLAPALVAIAAWIRDDQSLAERALKEAYARDPDRVSLLMLLVCRRFRRLAAAAAWLAPYLGRQDPHKLSREFIVVVDAVAAGAFGPEARLAARDVFGRWMRDLENEPGFVDSQVARWRSAFDAFAPDVDDSEYEALKKYSSDWPALRASLMAVRSYEPIAAHLARIVNDQILPSATLQAQIDEILDRLVADFDPEELPHRRREEYLQLVIDAGGDRDRADAQFRVFEQTLSQTSDFAGILTSAAMFQSEAGASRATQRYALGMTKDWLLSAHDQRVAATRAGRPMTARLSLDGWTETLAEHPDETMLVGSARREVARRTQIAVENVNVAQGRVVAVALGGLGLLIALATQSMLLGVIALVAVIYGIMGWNGLEDRRNLARTAGAQRADWIETQVRACVAAWIDYQRQWLAADAKQGAVRDLMVGFDAQQAGQRPIEGGREVLS